MEKDALRWQMAGERMKGAMRKICCCLAGILSFVFICVCVAERLTVFADERHPCCIYVEDLVDGFTPPEGKTIQHLLGFAMTRAAQLRIASEKECSPSSMLNITPGIRVANPVEKLPAGQHHRYTVQVFGTKEQEVYWQSSNPEVAQIDRVTGELTALKVGRTKVLVTDRQGGRVFDAVCLNVSEALTKEYEDSLYMLREVRPDSKLIQPWVSDSLLYDWDGEGMLYPPFEDPEGFVLPEDDPMAILNTSFQQSDFRGEIRLPAGLKCIALDNLEADIWELWTRGKKLVVDGNNTNYYSVSGVLFRYPFYTEPKQEEHEQLSELVCEYYVPRGDRALMFCYPNKSKTYYVPYGVERIEGLRLRNRLRKIVLPDTVTSIGYDAIDCQVLVIPASVTEIGDDYPGSAINVELIITTAGSAAEDYAKQHNIAYQTEEGYFPAQAEVEEE